MIPAFSIVAGLAGATFAWHGVNGLRKGEVRQPLLLLGADSYNREHTLYLGIVSLNFVLAAGLFVAAYLAREITI